MDKPFPFLLASFQKYLDLNPADGCFWDRYRLEPMDPSLRSDKSGRTGSGPAGMELLLAGLEQMEQDRPLRALEIELGTLTLLLQGLVEKKQMTLLGDYDWQGILGLLNHFQELLGTARRH